MPPCRPALTLCSAQAAAPTAEQRSRGEAFVESQYPQLERLYKDLHRAPELSFREERTGLRLGDELKQAGYDVTTRVGGHGVGFERFARPNYARALHVSARPEPSLHSSKFLPMTATTIKTGVKTFTAAVLELAGKR